jgi:hypothetical protein
VLPEEACMVVADCGDDAFVACRQGRCETGCSDDSACAGGVCVEGSCQERASLQDDEAAARVGLGAPGTLWTRSFVVPDPEAPSEALTLRTDPAHADLDVVAEASGDLWALHVATLRTGPGTPTVVGMPTVIDVDVTEGVPTRSFVTEHAYRGATSVAAEAMGAGPPAYLWTIEEPEPPGSDLQPLAFAFYGRGASLLQPMRTEVTENRFPPDAALASGLGVMRDQPAWGVRVVEGAESFFMAVGPSAGAGTQVNLPVAAAERGALEARGTRRAFLFRLADQRLALARLVGTNLVERPDESMLTGAVSDLDASSSCTPGIADRSALQEGNYVVATCSGAIVELRRLRCSLADALAPCVMTPWLQLPQDRAPVEVTLDPLRGGVAVLARSEAGVSAQLVPDDAAEGTAASGLGSLLPASYRVNALTDFVLQHVATTTATSAGRSVLAAAGLYVDDNDVAQVRVGIVSFAATP